jgi:hypothetical protein
VHHVTSKLQKVKGAFFLKIVVRVDYFLKLNYLLYSTKDYISDRYESVINI